MDKNKSIFFSILRVYKEIFQALPVLTTIEALSFVVNATIIGVMPLIWREMFSLFYGLYTSEIDSIVISVLVIFIMLQIIDAIGLLLGRLGTRFFGYNEKVIIVLTNKILSLSSKLPLEFYENTNLYNMFTRAINAVSQKKLLHLIQYLYQTPALLISIIITTIVLGSFSPWLVLVAVISIIPASIVRFKLGRVEYAMRFSQILTRRVKNYFYELFMDKRITKEIRTYNNSKFFIDKWAESNNLINKQDRKFFWNSIVKQLPFDLLRVVGYGFGILLSSFLLGVGALDISGFGASVTAFLSVQLVYDQFLRNFGVIDQNVMFFSDYESFMTQKPRKYGNVQQTLEPPGIEIRDLCFKYPDSDAYALKNINITISGAQTIALVGENGSGKTTLCRLILGIFSPTSGEIKINGTKTDQLSNVGLRVFSAVFQDYEQYRLDIRHNVALSDHKRLDNDTDISNAMQQARFEEVKYYDEPIGQEFNGIELSGGQWQKLALSRGYFPNNLAIVFDEPTSAIDPLLEAEIFDSFSRQVKGKTCILVTHRIGAARLAERIIVMKNGEVVQSGTHEILMQNKEGEYSKMFEYQAKWYR